MDFVVVGLGLGALGVLLGVLLLGWLAPRRERAADRAPSPQSAAYHRAIASEQRGMGQALLSAGAALILATIGGLAGSLDDRTGAFFVATTATVGALGLLVWGYLHRSRHPLPRRPRQRALADAIAPSAGAVSVTSDGPQSAHLDDTALSPIAAGPATEPRLAIFAEPSPVGDAALDDEAGSRPGAEATGGVMEQRHDADPAHPSSWLPSEEARDEFAADQSETIAVAAPSSRPASARTALPAEDEDGSTES